MLPGYLFCPFAMLSRLILLLLVLLPITTLATPLTILADEWPPFVFLDAASHPAGMAVEIVRALQQRTGDIAPMQLQDWTQALATMNRAPDHMMFTLDNDDQYRQHTQLGPIMVASIQAFAQGPQAAALSALPDSRLFQEPALATASSMAAAAAQQAGLKTYATRDGEQALRLLLGNRARLWVEANTMVAPQLRFLGQPANSVGSVRTLSSVPLYLTFSAGTSAETIQRWQQALQTMLQDGSYRDIHQRWLPLEAPLSRVQLRHAGQALPQDETTIAPLTGAGPETGIAAKPLP